VGAKYFGYPLDSGGPVSIITYVITQGDNTRRRAV
jgi:hypothetical protein